MYFHQPIIKKKDGAMETMHIKKEIVLFQVQAT
jgi:hypothetical protein